MTLLDQLSRTPFSVASSLDDHFLEVRLGNELYGDGIRSTLAECISECVADTPCEPGTGWVFCHHAGSLTVCRCSCTCLDQAHCPQVHR